VLEDQADGNLGGVERLGHFAAGIADRPGQGKVVTLLRVEQRGAEAKVVLQGAEGILHERLEHRALGASGIEGAEETVETSIEKLGRFHAERPS
jgi:hypothetical protein